MRVILCGFPKCGKTYYGKLLAVKLNLPFVDTDFLIQEASGKTPRELSKLYGEQGFRTVEKQLIFSLKILASAVISIGGGAILDSDNANELKTLGKIIYLKIDKETLKKRIFKDSPSYLDLNNKEGSFKKMYDERKPLYEKIASFEIVTNEKSDSTVISEIQEALYGK